jgi:hypothetical protein
MVDYGDGTARGPRLDSRYAIGVVVHTMWDRRWRDSRYAKQPGARPAGPAAGSSGVVRHPPIPVPVPPWVRDRTLPPPRSPQRVAGGRSRRQGSDHGQAVT